MAHQLAAISALLKRIPGDSGTATELRIALQRVEKEAAALAGIVPDAMKSDAANSMILNAEKARLRELIAKASEQCRVLIDREKATEQSKLAERLALVPNEFAAEVRSVFRELSPEKQNEFMATSIAAKDAATVAALVDCPTILCGLPAERQAAYKLSYVESVAPSVQSETAEMQSCVNGIIATAGSLAQP